LDIFAASEVPGNLVIYKKKITKMPYWVRTGSEVSQFCEIMSVALNIIEDEQKERFHDITVIQEVSEGCWSMRFLILLSSQIVVRRTVDMRIR
jgi:methyl coenzyme M reductase subunit C-like uncharacterized protein (methanogenesis marker protein 7)